VSVILCPAVLVNKIGVGGPVTDDTPRVFDLVGWVKKLSTRKSFLIAACLTRNDIRGRGSRRLGVVAREVTETRGFIHVYPESVDIDSGVCVEELPKLVIPVVLYFLMKPVWKRGHTRPDSAFEDASVAFLEEDASLNSMVVGIIVLCGDSCGN
jgi:hypothetical protein